MAAATRVLAAKGFAGATVESIVGAAGVNMRMIYHYYGYKAGLYVAVLEDFPGQLRQAELQPIADVGTAIEGVSDMFDMILQHVGVSPEFVLILSTENIMSARFLTSSGATPEIALPSERNIVTLLDRSQEDGTCCGTAKTHYIQLKVPNN